MKVVDFEVGDKVEFVDSDGVVLRRISSIYAYDDYSYIIHGSVIVKFPYKNLPEIVAKSHDRFIVRYEDENGKFVQLAFLPENLKLAIGRVEKLNTLKKRLIGVKND